MKKLNLLLLFFAIAIANNLNAQGLLDGFAPKKNELSVTVSYTNSTFDEFYVGKEKIDVPVHEEISQDIISLYAKYGITDRLSVVFSVPYISADNESGLPDPVNQENSVSGVQDISAALKYNAASFKIKGNKVDLITGLAVNVPTNDYEPNGILSLGSGALAIDVTAGYHYQTKSGFFSTVLASYSFRDDADNNLQPGGDFGVPNAFLLNSKIGYASDFIYVEAWASLQNSEEGVDIGAPNFTDNFPETNVDYTKIGLTLYKNIIPQIGLSLGYGKVIDGRNVGASTTYSAGLTYCFVK